MENAANTITEKDLDAHKDYLFSKGHTKSTIEKYAYDAGVFGKFIKNKKITPKILDSFKNKRLKHYTVVGARSVIFNVNTYLSYIDCPYKIEQIEPSNQKRDVSKTAITKEEYLEILKAIKRSGNDRLQLICSANVGVTMRLGKILLRKMPHTKPIF